MDVMSTWIMDAYLEKYNHAKFQYLKTYACQDNIFPMDAPSWSKRRTYIFYIVNIMAADVLATLGARASAATILT